MNIGFLSLLPATESPIQFWIDAVRCRVSGQVLTVRRRRSHLSAWTTPSSGHGANPCLRRDIHSTRASHFAPPSPRRAPPRFGDLLRPLNHVSSRASPPRAPPRRPLPRRPSLSLSRALVRPHCQLRRELHLAGVRRGHRRRGQASLLHHFSPFLFLALSLEVNISCARLHIACSAAELPFTPTSPLELGRVRVSHLGRSALVRGSRLCP